MRCAGVEATPASLTRVPTHGEGAHILVQLSASELMTNEIMYAHFLPLAHISLISASRSQPTQKHAVLSLSLSLPPTKHTTPQHKHTHAHTHSHSSQEQSVLLM